MTEPRWMRWTPPLAVVWCTAYAIVHASWAIGGAPDFGDLGESFLPEGWTPVVPAASAAIVAALAGTRAARSQPASWVSAVLAWSCGIALLLYAIMFPLSLLMALGALFGQPVSRADLVVLLAQGAGAVAGVLASAVAVLAQRRTRAACPRCGRVHGRSPEKRDVPRRAGPTLPAT
ncbi:hypothetical protein [Micromonospora sp. NPDC051006]|uniref:hypothetical protein n=1 Tax=Micromonospora sp. NPDC051006 TaxID=3364283 RepID=UPI00378EA884